MLLLNFGGGIVAGIVLIMLGIYGKYAKRRKEAETNA
jgi:hypothetical protein